MLFTDGLTESPGPANEQIGRERITEFLRKHSEKSASSIVQGVIEWVSSYRQAESPPENISVMVMKIIE